MAKVVFFVVVSVFADHGRKIGPSNLVPRSHSDLGTKLRPISPAQVANQNKVLASSSHIINSVNNSSGGFFGGYYIALPITKKWIKLLTGGKMFDMKPYL